MMMEQQVMLNDTVDLLKELNERQLTAIHAIILELSAKKDDWWSPLEIETDGQLWAHIDCSVEQAHNGLGRDADEVIDDLLKVYAV